MSIQELLKPKFKVIGDYPGNKLKVGEIYYDTNELITEVTISEGDYTVVNPYIYPKVFEKVEWWEYLSEYIAKQIGYAKTIAGNSVRMVESIDVRLGKITFVGGKVRNIRQWLPATEDEYEAFINRNK